MIEQPKPAKWPSRFASTLLLFSVLVCGWGGMSLFSTSKIPVFYWAVAAVGNWGLLVLVGAWLSLILLIVVRIRWKFHVGMLVGSAFFVCAGTFGLFWGGMSHVDSVTFNGHVFHLALREDGKWSSYILCECDSVGLFCHCHAFYERYMVGQPATNSLVVDNGPNELTVRAGDDIIYQVSASTQCYEIEGYCLDR